MFDIYYLTKYKKCDIILNRLMAHYSSQLIRYEDGDKIPLKSISMRPLVFAIDAQSRANAGDESSG